MTFHPQPTWLRSMGPQSSAFRRNRRSNERRGCTCPCGINVTCRIQVQTSTLQSLPLGFEVHDSSGSPLVCQSWSCRNQKEDWNQWFPRMWFVLVSDMVSPDVMESHWYSVFPRFLAPWSPLLVSMWCLLFLKLFPRFPFLSVARSAKTWPASYKYSKTFAILTFRPIVPTFKSSSTCPQKSPLPLAKSAPHPMPTLRKKVITERGKLDIIVNALEGCSPSYRRRNRTTQSCLNCHTSKRMVGCISSMQWPRR